MALEEEGWEERREVQPPFLPIPQAGGMAWAGLRGWGGAGGRGVPPRDSKYTPRVGYAQTSSAQTYPKPSLWDNPRFPKPGSASGSPRSQRTHKSASSDVVNPATAPASTQTATRWRQH